MFCCHTYSEHALIQEKIIWSNGHGNPNLGYILALKKDQKPCNLGDPLGGLLLVHRLKYLPYLGRMGSVCVLAGKFQRIPQIIRFLMQNVSYIRISMAVWPDNFFPYQYMLRICVRNKTFILLIFLFQIKQMSRQLFLFLFFS